MGNKQKKSKAKKQWGKTQVTYSIVAGIAALIGVVVYFIAIHSFSDDVDYADAPQVTSEVSMNKFKSYTGKIIIQGIMTGETYAFEEKYDAVSMAKKTTVAGRFLYSDLILQRPEKYVKNQKEVDYSNVLPEYAYRNQKYSHKRQADDLNLFGVKLDMEKFVLVGLTDYGELYDTTAEDAFFRAIEGPEVPVVILGDMENGEFINGNFYVNGTIEKAISDAGGGLLLFPILLAVWLLICGFVFLSMYLQRYDEME